MRQINLKTVEFAKVILERCAKILLQIQEQLAEYFGDQGAEE